MLKQNAPSRKRPPPEPATSVDKKKAKEGPPLDPDWDPKEHYDMKREKFIDSEKFKTKQSDYRIKIKPFGTANFGEIRERLERIFQAIIDEARLMAAPNSRGHTLLTMNGVEKAISNYEININELKAEAILNKIEAILNSNQETSAEDFNMRFIFTEQPHGGISTPAFHNRSGPDLDPKVFRARKLALMDVAKDANDKMCLARCLYVGQHVADNPGNFRNTTKPNFKTIIDSRGSKQKLGARSLCRKADVSAYQESGITELQKFQDYLTNYQIICYESISGGTSICFPTEEMIEKQDKRIYLWLYKNHYTLINPNMLAGFHGTHYFCHNCLQAWDCVGIHKCEKAVCKLCKNVNCKNETSQADDTPLHCDECNCDYQSIQCHTSHKESKECDKKYYCERCRKTVSQKNKEPSLHHCLLNKCWYCNGFFEPGEHKCYVQRPKKKDLQVPEEEEDIHYLYGEFNEENGYEDDTLAAERKKKKYFYCDLECELNEDGQDKRHDTILFCMVSEDGTREWAYYGEDCMQQFFKEINENADFKDSTFVFHNFSGYDGIHMLKMFYDNGIDPRPLFRGCRVLSMSLRQLGIRFIDSFLHMSIPLAKFADCYDIKGAEKGKFPYNFATKANRDYVGPLPPIEFFDVENMLPEQKAEFLEWYLLEKAKYDADPTKVFDLRKEMLKYCMNDCHVLRKGFMKHRETMKLQNKGLDPADKITLPSYVNQVYRTNNMPKDSLAILPPRGYDQRGMQSTNALIWLLWLSKKYGYHIIHGRNRTEVKVGPFYLDGFTKTQFGIKKAFEYNGCPWHGCPDCYPDELADTEFRGKTYRQRQMNTKDKKEFLEARGYEVVSIYSCEFRRAQEIDPEMKEFVRKMKPRLQKAKPLAPRDCLRGGRTNAITNALRT